MSTLRLACVPRWACLLGLACGLAAPGFAQTPVPPPAPVQSQPLPPLAPAPAPMPAPAPVPTPAPAVPAPPAATAPAAPPVAARPGSFTTLAPAPADPSMPDEVQLASRPATALRGQSTWDDGYETLMKTFEQLRAETGKAGIKVTGAPLATFLETDDLGFQFEAQLPVEALPASRPPGLPPAVTFAQTPAGRAIRFTHDAPYDDIDSTYEAITAYLDAKGIEVKENFTEEYVNPGAHAGDASLQIYIYVLPK